MKLKMSTQGMTDFKKGMDAILRSNSPEEIEKHLRKGGNIIRKQAVSNIKELNTGTSDDFADTIVVKKQKGRHQRVKVGPTQAKLNQAKKVKWKGQEVPMVHWGELGTRPTNVGRGLDAKYPVWRAYKSKKDEAKSATIKGLMKKIKDACDRSHVLKATGL